MTAFNSDPDAYLEFYEIGDLTFAKTCSACPEQYDVFDENRDYVGYVRLRHGFLLVENACGTTVMTGNPPGSDGAFVDEDQRLLTLNLIAGVLHR